MNTGYMRIMMSNIVRVLTFIDKSGETTIGVDRKPLVIKHLKKENLA
jgi:hypothetical protein